MAEKDAQWGIIILIAAAFFLISGLEMLDIKFEFFDPGTSTLIAFVLVAIGVYLVTKK